MTSEPKPSARRLLVAVVGDASVVPEDPKAGAAYELGRLIIDRRWRLVTGGLGGVMAHASAGARSSPHWRDGDIIGIIPGSDPSAANPYVDVVVPTGMDHLRNSIVAHCDALVVVGGGAGTLSEMALAWIYRRLIIALPHEGWGGKLAGTRLDSRTRYPDIADDCVWPASDPTAAIDLISKMSAAYGKRHNGIGPSRFLG